MNKGNLTVDFTLNKFMCIIFNLRTHLIQKQIKNGGIYENTYC